MTHTLYFISSILASLIIPISLSFLITKRLPFSRNNWRDTFKVNSNTWLLSQPLFWCSILTPFLLFLSFGLFVWKDLTISMKLSGYNEFLRISELPLWLLAIAAPMSVIVARAHATEQTAKQILELESKNISDRNISHRNSFISHVTLVYEENNPNLMSLYRNLYSLKSNNIPKLDLIFFEELSFYYKDLLDISSRIREPKIELSKLKENIITYIDILLAISEILETQSIIEPFLSNTQQNTTDVIGSRDKIRIHDETYNLPSTSELISTNNKVDRIIKGIMDYEFEKYDDCLRIYGSIFDNFRIDELKRHDNDIIINDSISELMNKWQKIK